MIISTFKKRNGRWSHTLSETGREYDSQLAAATAMVEACSRTLAQAKTHLAVVATEKLAAADEEYRLGFYSTSTGRG